ncbi:hypothetical protein [Nicoliella lavandulae]|uniref:Uncharacterized protein n=1 Tax=Nicoliella lavandulae TaxID=3082954 RepID=A0ABU8SMQ0_9LACO
MTQIGITDAGHTVNLSDNPFDHVAITFPNWKGGKTLELTNDLMQGNSFTVTPATAAFQNTQDWGDNSHFSHSNDHSATGTIIPVQDSDVDKLLMGIFKKSHPVKGDLSDATASECVFNVRYWNSANGKELKAQGCLITNLPAFEVSNGSNSTQNGNSYPFTATDYDYTPAAPADKNYAVD